MPGKSKASARSKPGGKKLGKRKTIKDAVDAVPKHVAGKESGDVDDFEYMLDLVPEAQGGGTDEEDDAARLEGSGGEGSGGEAGREGLSGEEDGEEGGQAEEQPAKKKRKKAKKKRGPKPSALEFEASRELAAGIAGSPAADQADWLWHSFQQSTGASSLEQEGLTADCLVELPHEGTLEERLKALAPRDWQRRFCSRGVAVEPGAPALLLVSPAAMGAVRLIKHCPEFHKACRVAKLFAKHIKVSEQQELLGKQVVCVAAGTPNRITQLADLGALRLGNLSYVVLDTALDAKKRTILDIPETRRDWWQLFSKHLRGRLAAGQTKLALLNSDELGE